MKHQSGQMVSIAVLFAAGVCATPAHAEIVTFRVDGILTRIDDPDGMRPLVSNVGDGFSVFYDFETATPATVGGNTPPWIRRYDAISNFRLHIGGVELTVPTVFGEISIENDDCQPFSGCMDSYHVIASNSVIDPLFVQVQFGLSSTTPTAGAALTSLALPTQPLDAMSFAVRSAQFHFLDPYANRGAYLYGTLDSINAVPLPGAALLLASGLAVGGLRRRRTLDSHDFDGAPDGAYRLDRSTQNE